MCPPAVAFAIALDRCEAKGDHEAAAYVDSSFEMVRLLR